VQVINQSYKTGSNYCQIIFACFAVDKSIGSIAGAFKRNTALRIIDPEFAYRAFYMVCIAQVFYNSQLLFLPIAYSVFLLPAVYAAGKQTYLRD
jgi:hypothetical protein